jgi:hypothetical protein
MESIHVLGRVNPVEDPFAVDVFRERELDQDTMNRGIVVEPVDRRQQLGFADRGRQLEVQALPLLRT